MATGLRLTLTELAGAISRRFDQQIPIWKLRRVVDELESQDEIDVQRVANYRTVTDGDIGVVVRELQRIGWLKSEAVQCS